MPLFGGSQSQAEEAAGATVRCPSCHEPVPAETLICPHCKGVLPPRAQAGEGGIPGAAVATASVGAGQPSPDADHAARQAEQTPGERIRIEHASGGDTQAMPVSGETALAHGGTGAARPSGREEGDPEDLPAAPPEAEPDVEAQGRGNDHG